MTKKRPQAATPEVLAVGAEKPKKIQVRKPTLKQKKAAELLVANGRKKGKTMSKGDILREAGYSEAVATQPEKVLDSRGFKEIFDELIPDSLIATTHKNLLTAKRGIYFMGAKVGEEENHDAQGRGLDMAYKIKGSYAPERVLTGDLAEWLNKTDEELDEMLQREAQVINRFNEHKPKKAE